MMESVNLLIFKDCRYIVTNKLFSFVNKVEKKIEMYENS